MTDPHPDLDRPALLARIAELEQQVAASAGTKPTDPLHFQALLITNEGWASGWQLRPGPARRNWMSEQPVIYQCLPMVVANQWGWQVLCPTDVTVVWDGSPALAGLKVMVTDPWGIAIKSQFGRGIVTFTLPWVFRTPPGWDLYVKGPSNRWKDNCATLEGVIETWWLPYTFTLNWKLMEPGQVHFAKGESLGQLFPVPHATFENAVATESPIRQVDPKAADELVRWRDERRRIANSPQPTHRRYLKAEEVEDHLTRISVPPVRRTGGEAGPTAPKQST